MLYSRFNNEEDTITMYDNDGNEMSMFVLDEDENGIKITEYRNLTDKPQNIIVLPSFDLENDRELTQEEVNEIKNSPRLAEKHIYGKIRLGNGLFRNFSNITVVAQQQAPIAIEEECFDVDSNCSLIIPRNMTLFDVRKINEYYPEGFPSHYYFIGDKRLNLDYYDANRFRTTLVEHGNTKELNLPNIFVSSKYFVEDGKIQERSKLIEQ